MLEFPHAGGAAVAVVLLFVQVAPQNHAADIRSRIAHEPDPVRRAKLMPQLSDVVLQDIQRQMAEGDLVEALAELKGYRDDVQQTQKDLDARNVDAEKHPSGFKQLQISLREALRRLDEAVVGLPADEAKPFVVLRKELDQINRHLIRELFPRQPAAEEDSPRPKN